MQLPCHVRHGCAGYSNSPSLLWCLPSQFPLLSSATCLRKIICGPGECPGLVCCATFVLGIGLPSWLVCSCIVAGHDKANLRPTVCHSRLCKWSSLTWLSLQPRRYFGDILGRMLIGVIIANSLNNLDLNWGPSSDQIMSGALVWQNDCWMALTSTVFTLAQNSGLARHRMAQHR